MSTSTKRKAATPYRTMKIGQGVDALFGETPNSSEPNLEQSIAIEEIFLPSQQPRRYFDPEAMQSLVDSIRRDGILEPILVRVRNEGGYELVAGERRYRAAKEVALAVMPVVIRQMTDEQALHIALIENLLREDLNPLEETEGILQLLALRLKADIESVISLLYRMQNDLQRLTHNVMGQPDVEIVKAVFSEVGVAWESFINNRLPLLKLPDDILQALRGGQLAYTKAQAIARVKDEVQRSALLQETTDSNLSLSQIREHIKNLNPVDTEKTVPTMKQQLERACRSLVKSKLMDDPKKQKQLLKLLTQIESLLSGEESINE